jgi:hypothetical protein
MFKEEIKFIPQEIDGIEYIAIPKEVDENLPIQEFEFGNTTLSSSTQALIGVAVACTTLIFVAVFIIGRGRNQSNYNRHYNDSIYESNGIIPDRHIRSDDSVSNSPTMSSGARVGASGRGGVNAWDETSSQSDAISESSSRPSFTVQLEEAPNGIEASRDSMLYQSNNYTSYLPSSVLKDLLDGGVGQSKSIDVLDNPDM